MGDKMPLDGAAAGQRHGYGLWTSDSTEAYKVGGILPIRGGQDYLGHANVVSTMVYTPVVKNMRPPARSPFDALRRQA